MRQETTTTFTPVFETVLQEMGAQAALVFGRVWRYCQAPGGECYASQRKLAEGLGLSAATVNRALKRLVEAGYLRNATPDQRYAPHRYRDASKATGVLPAETGEQKGVSDSNAVLP